MSKLFQIVAIVLIAAVLGGAQCADLCNFLAPQQAKVPPCHHQQPSADQCTHHEIIAEQHSVNAAVDPAISLEQSQISAVLLSSAEPRLAPTDVLHEPDRHAPHLITVLRL